MSTPEFLALFDVAEPEVAETEGARRRARQIAAIRRGQHPLSVALRSPLPLHPAASRDGAREDDGTPRCGTCDHRELLPGGNRSFPKCLAGTYVSSRARWSTERPTEPQVRPDGRVTITVHPRASHGTGTDVASWWPACGDYYRAGGADPVGPSV